VDATANIGTVPSTDGRAGDDPYTELRYRFVRRRIRQLAAGTTWCVVVAAVLLALTAWHRSNILTAAAVSVLILAVVLAAVLIRASHTRRRVEALWRDFAWRPVSFTLIHGGRQDKRPTGVVVLDGREMGLRLFQTPWAVQQLLIRHGQAWLCGPDSRGRARLRVVGLTSSRDARVLDKIPHGAPMAPPATPRRTGGLNSYLIGYPVAVVFLFALAAVTYVGGLRHGQNLVSLIAGEALFVLALLPTRRAWRTWLVMRARPARGGSPTVLPFELTSWTPGGSSLSGVAVGVLRLADDTRVMVTVPHAGVDLIANPGGGTRDCPGRARSRPSRAARHLRLPDRRNGANRHSGRCSRPVRLSGHWPGACRGGGDPATVCRSGRRSTSDNSSPVAGGVCASVGHLA
jgi:hypothetical protein